MRVQRDSPACVTLQTFILEGGRTYYKAWLFDNQTEVKRSDGSVAFYEGDLYQSVEALPFPDRNAALNWFIGHFKEEVRKAKENEK